MCLSPDDFLLCHCAGTLPIYTILRLSRTYKQAKLSHYFMIHILVSHHNCGSTCLKQRTIYVYILLLFLVILQIVAISFLFSQKINAFNFILNLFVSVWCSFLNGFSFGEIGVSAGLFIFLDDNFLKDDERVSFMGWHLNIFELKFIFQRFFFYFLLYLNLKLFIHSLCFYWIHTLRTFLKAAFIRVLPVERSLIWVVIIGWWLDAFNMEISFVESCLFNINYFDFEGSWWDDSVVSWRMLVICFQILTFSLFLQFISFEGTTPFPIDECPGDRGVFGGSQAKL